MPNSVLWLLRFPAAGEMRLRACNIPLLFLFFELNSTPVLSLAVADSPAYLCFLNFAILADAISKGVRAGQIIFTDVAAKNEHIRRSSLADLFLDT